MLTELRGIASSLTVFTSLSLARLIWNDIHYVKPVRCCGHGDIYLEEGCQLLGHLMRQFLSRNGMWNLSRIPRLDLMRLNEQTNALVQHASHLTSP